MTRRIATLTVALAVVTIAPPGTGGGVFALRTSVALAASPPPLTTRRGVVASDERVASQVGARVLAEGGNAVDAAAATVLALGVVNPLSSGIGGGGFAVIYIARTHKLYAVDFRETAPAALTPKNFVRGGVPDESLARRGGLAVGVPGEVAGLAHMVKKYGRLPWRRVVAPAVRLARHGFRASWFLGRGAGWIAAHGKRDPAVLAVIAPGGHPIVGGEWVRRPRLARTLDVIAARGAAGFYRGRVARDIVGAVRRAGGVMTLTDLAHYRAIDRRPLTGSFHGYRIAAMPLPSSGGIAMLEALGILQATGIHLVALGAGSSAAYQLIAEALKHAFADRARFLGDAASAKARVPLLLAPARLARLARRVSLRHVQRHNRYGSRRLGRAVPPPEDHGTSHLCVVDRAGDAVALTTTVNGYLGAKVIAPQSGVVLNNEIDDFSIAPGTANQFGLVQSNANLVGPGKRPLSSMTPTLVLRNGRIFAVAGGSGGPRIISETMQALLNVIVFGMNASAAVSAPRIHDQWIPDKLYVEKDIPRDVRRGLARRGQHIQLTSELTATQLIVVRPDGVREAASDPRKGGAPAAEPRRRRWWGARFIRALLR